jgi:hypothetical protein
VRTTPKRHSESDRRRVGIQNQRWNKMTLSIENTRFRAKVQSGLFNVDANHDGTMDLSYSGPDQTSPIVLPENWTGGLDGD